MVAPRDERDHQARHRKGRHDVGLTRLVWADAGAGPTKLDAIGQLPRCAKIRYDIPGDLKLVRSLLPESLQAAPILAARTNTRTSRPSRLSSTATR